MNGIHEVTGSIPVWSTTLRSPLSPSELRMEATLRSQSDEGQAKTSFICSSTATAGLYVA